MKQKIKKVLISLFFGFLLLGIPLEFTNAAIDLNLGNLLQGPSPAQNIDAYNREISKLQTLEYQLAEKEGGFIKNPATYDVLIQACQKRVSEATVALTVREQIKAKCAEYGAVKAQLVAKQNASLQAENTNKAITQNQEQTIKELELRNQALQELLEKQDKQAGDMIQVLVQQDQEVDTLVASLKNAKFLNIGLSVILGAFLIYLTLLFKRRRKENVSEGKQNLPQFEKNKLATTGFILGLASIFFATIGIIPILAVIFSGIGLCRARKRKEGGTILAIIGLILGVIYTLAYLSAYGHI